VRRKQPRRLLRGEHSPRPRLVDATDTFERQRFDFDLWTMCVDIATLPHQSTRDSEAVSRGSVGNALSKPAVAKPRQPNVELARRAVSDRRETK
jgi:hypothetical protein